VELGEVGELLAHAHLRIEPAFLGHVADPRRVDARSGSPRQRTSPASASSTPSMIRMAVVLPAPLGPTKPKIWPAATEKKSRSRATCSP
jgi:hypothetical protein